ncbi:MAG: DEAD/DEAH box helicase [Gammaproteobacteria bacterium]
MSFSSMGLNEALLRAVVSQGYTTPTAIQLQAIPTILAGHDLLAAAQTGTGKTAAFTLPLLQKLLDSGSVPKDQRKPRALVLTPTRELAVQVADSIRTYGRNVPIRTATIYGGAGMYPQIETLRRGVDIIVATPGRLLDHLERRTVDLSNVETLVLDEADRMLDMGFIRPIEQIISKLAAKRQNLLFSATFSNEIRKLAEGLLQSPQTIDIAPRNTAVDLVNQQICHVDKGNKKALLVHLIQRDQWGQVLIFMRTKHGADRLTRQLQQDGLRAVAIHGDKSQSQRTRALNDFKRGRANLLVATDVAARGLDIDALPHVVNFELPQVAEDYVHRIGRTGRAGLSGEALSLVSPDEVPQLQAIEQALKRSLPVMTETGFTLATPIKTSARAGKPHHRPRSKPGYSGRPQRSKRSSQRQSAR